MNETSLEVLLALLLVLLVCSAYFSASETAMMSLNRYRLRHLAKQHHKGALRTSRLLANPDRLIGVILIGNNFVNILASSIATVIAIRLWGDAGVLLATAILTVLILIFSEVTPKTVATLYPEQIAYPSSVLLQGLLKLLYPLVWLVSWISSSLLRLCGLRTQPGPDFHLSTEELRTVVDESARKIPRQRQDMLLNVLDLEKVTVNDIMVTRNDVVGIDIDEDMDDILNTLAHSSHTRLPVYNRDLNNVVGILHIRNAARLMVMEAPNKAELLQLTREPYFVPESTPLPTQLVNFQKQQRRIALVVDEYGDVKGIVTLEDILEEIVGNFTSNLSEETTDIHPQADGSYLIDGSTSIREINRSLGWSLPTDGPKTLSGLLTELLESIPDNHVGIRLPGHCAEIIQVKDNIIKTVRMWTLEDTRNDNDDLAEIQANLYD
ncbi:MAG: HlyC/CorC family transporter [Pseudohongiellaceae bacterium]